MTSLELDAVIEMLIGQRPEDEHPMAMAIRGWK